MISLSYTVANPWTVTIWVDEWTKDVRTSCCKVWGHDIDQHINTYKLDTHWSNLLTQTLQELQCLLRGGLYILHVVQYL